MTTTCQLFKKNRFIGLVGIERPNPQTSEIKFALVTFTPDTKVNEPPFTKPVGSQLTDEQAVEAALRLCGLNPQDFSIKKV